MNSLIQTQENNPFSIPLNQSISKSPNKWAWVISKLKCGSPLFMPQTYFFQLNQIRNNFVHIETYILILQYQDPRTFYIQYVTTHLKYIS